MELLSEFESNEAEDLVLSWEHYTTTIVILTKQLKRMRGLLTLTLKDLMEQKALHNLGILYFNKGRDI